jgi:hypothetical protein
MLRPYRDPRTAPTNRFSGQFDSPSTTSPLVEALTNRQLNDPGMIGGNGGGMDYGNSNAGLAGGSGSAGYSGDDSQGFIGSNETVGDAAFALGFVPGPIGTMASLVGFGNSALGAYGGYQQGQEMGRVTGVNPTAMDNARSMAAGFVGNNMLGRAIGGARYGGIGGYGKMGVGGVTNAMNMADPGVAGPARAQAAARVNAQINQQRAREAESRAARTSFQQSRSPGGYMGGPNNEGFDSFGGFADAAFGGGRGGNSSSGAGRSAGQGGMQGGGVGRGGGGAGKSGYGGPR